MTGNDNIFDMEAALVAATDFGLALVDKYRDQLRGLADTGEPLDLPDYLERFGASCEIFIRHVLEDAVRRGASPDEAVIVGYAFTDACHQRLAVMAEGVRR